MLKHKKTGLIVLLLGLMLLSSCRAKGPDFAIFLLSEQMAAGEAQMMALADLPLEQTPFISMEDVVMYNPSTYEMTLTESAAAIVHRLGIPVNGMPFVVVARGERIFMGAFWTPVSSLSYSGIVAMPSLEEDSSILYFDLGYPSADFFEGVDLRDNEQIIKAFSKAEKLSETE